MRQHHPTCSFYVQQVGAAMRGGAEDHAEELAALRRLAARLKRRRAGAAEEAGVRADAAKQAVKRRVPGVSRGARRGRTRDRCCRLIAVVALVAGAAKECGAASSLRRCSYLR